MRLTEPLYNWPTISDRTLTEAVATLAASVHGPERKSQTKWPCCRCFERDGSDGLECRAGVPLQTPEHQRAYKHIGKHTIWGRMFDTMPLPLSQTNRWCTRSLPTCSDHDSAIQQNRRTQRATYMECDCAIGQSPAHPAQSDADTMRSLRLVGVPSYPSVSEPQLITTACLPIPSSQHQPHTWFFPLPPHCEQSAPRAGATDNPYMHDGRRADWYRI